MRSYLKDDDRWAARWGKRKDAGPPARPAKDPQGHIHRLPATTATVSLAGSMERPSSLEPMGVAGTASPVAVRWARWLSGVGHPALLVPVGTALQSWQHGESPRMALCVGGVALLMALVIAGESQRRVRRGDWVDADASRPEERRQLQKVLLAVLVLPAIVLAVLGAPRPWVWGFAGGAILVLVAQGLRRWQKMSLHVAFGMLVVAPLWPTPLGLAGTALVLGVAWSRVLLRRHTRVEVVTGGGVGTLAGLAWGAA